MTDATPTTPSVDVDPLVDNRTAVYDQLESKPYALLQEEVTELITETVEAAGREASDVERALMSEPLDEDWWFSTTKQRALEAIVVAGDEGLIRIDVAFELGASRDLTVPSPDALPILNDEDEITIYCLMETETSLSATTGNVTVEGVVVDEDDTGESGGGEKDGADGDTSTEPGGPTTISLVGPEGQQDTVEVPPEKSVGFVVTKIKTTHDVYDGEVGLYADQRYSSTIPDDEGAGQFDGDTVYWRLERRAG